TGVSLNISCWGLFDRHLLLRKKLHLQLLDDCVSDLVLDRENVGEIAIKTVGPNMTAVSAVDKLSSNANTGCDSSYASFQNKTYPQFTSDLLDFDRLAFVGKRGVSRRKEEARNPGEVVG